MNSKNLSAEASGLIALELYRKDKVSLGRAAELCHVPLEQFMEFAARHNASLHYAIGDLEEDRRTLERVGCDWPPQLIGLCRGTRLSIPTRRRS